VIIWLTGGLYTKADKAASNAGGCLKQLPHRADWVSNGMAQRLHWYCILSKPVKQVSHIFAVPCRSSRWQKLQQVGMA